MNGQPAQHWESKAQAQAFRDGVLAGPQACERTAHLAECRECREVLARIQDGMDVDPTSEERDVYKRQFDNGPGGTFRSVAARVERESAHMQSVGDPTPPSWLELLTNWLRRPRLIGGVVGIAVIVLAIAMWQPSHSSRRQELNALYARAGSTFPAWTGSPGRLVQPFTSLPAEPVRASAASSPSENAAIQNAEDSLLRLALRDEGEKAERDIAVAVLRLARGEVSSAWSIVSRATAMVQTEQGLSALACTAIATGDSTNMRSAAETLARSDLPSPILIYDHALLRHYLGQDARALSLLKEYESRVPDQDPWGAQLQAIIGDSTTNSDLRN